MAVSYTGNADESTCPLPVPADCAHAKLYHVKDDAGSFDALDECTEPPLSHAAASCDSFCLRATSAAASLSCPGSSSALSGPGLGSLLRWYWCK